MKIGYIRNSRITQDNSVEVQNKLINDFCENNRIKLDKIIIDEGISGSSEKTKMRDGYNSIIEMIHNQEIDTLVVISISRWTLGLMLAQTERYGGIVMDTKKGTLPVSLDTPIPDGREYRITEDE